LLSCSEILTPFEIGRNITPKTWTGWREAAARETGMAEPV